MSIRGEWRKMTQTNIKGLPEGKYFTEIGYSQRYPWAEIGRTATTAKLARVIVQRDPDWRPEIASGGFAGHCANQDEQTWLFKGVKPTDVVTIRKTKHGWSNKGVKFVEDMAWEFYDYNF